MVKDILLQATMNISVRVASRDAQNQIKALQSQVNSLEKELARANSTGSALGGGNKQSALVKWGNQLQWTGRQLQYNWTLPLVVAGTAATKWAMDNEKAFTHVRKVYGDSAAATAYFNKHQAQVPAGMTASTMATRVFNQELSSLRKSFVEMSNYYGVAQKDVLNVAGAWAAAGKSGVELAKSVNLTMQAMILGDMDATKATEALISIQAQYGESTQGLARDLAYMNAIENQTAISLPGLIEGFARSAGVAREAGIDVRHLGALLAAMVPAAGTAANAGNALKTVISRLLSPTKEASQVMEAAGIQINKAAWQSANAKDRLFQLADAFKKMSDGQRNVAASVIASRWQINKFDVLLRALINHHSMYYQALSATASKTKAFAIQQKELNAVLNSSPRRLAIIWQTMKNGAADAIQPLIPYILYLANLFKELVTRFANLDPGLQKFILLLALGLAAVGPLTRYLGSMAALLGTVEKGFKLLIPTLAMVNGELTIVSRGIIGTALAFLAWPFRAIYSMFGAMFGRLFMLFRLFPTIVMASMSFSMRAVQALSVMPAIFAAAGRGIMAIWAGTWAAVRGFTLVAMAQIRIIQVGAAVFSASLWTRTSAILTAIHLALSRSVGLIWRSMAATMIATSRTSAIAATAMIRSPLAILRGGGGLLLKAFTNPYVLGAAAVIGVMYIFRNQIAKIWHNVISYFSDTSNGLVKSLIGAWNLLPQGIQNALAAVVRIVHAAAMQVYEWFSYLNPFAHHSPSLVENVQGGMGKVGQHLATVKDTGKHFDAAHRSIEKYGRAAANVAPDVSARRTANASGPATGAIQALVASNNRAQQAASQAQIAKFDPKAAQEYAQLAKLLDQLTPKLNSMSAAIKKQQTVVDGAQASLDSWNKKLDGAQNKLNSLQSVADKWSQKLSAAQDALSNYANAPLKGMQDMNDQIHANDMAQKHLQYQMLQMEKVTGTLDSVKTKMAAINGQQELLRGQKMDLVAAGAGSEITGVFDKQISGLEKTKKQYTSNMQALQDMQDALDSLQTKANELDLQKSLKFDDLTYQIEKAANMTKELSFDDIMNGIKKSKDDIALYTQKWNEASAAVAAQQTVVDSLTKHRDAAQAVVDKEQNKLDGLKAKYDALNQSIQDIKQTMDDAASAAQNMQQALDSVSKKNHAKKGHSPAETIGLQNFKAASIANFPDVGGAGKAMRTNWQSQAKGIDDVTKGLMQSQAKLFGDLNPFAPLRNKWNQFVGWLKKEWAVLKPGISDFFSKAFGNIHMPAALGGQAKKLGDMFTQVKSTAEAFGSWAAKWGKRVWALLGPDIVKFFKNAWDGIKSVFNQVAPEIVKFGQAFAPTGKVFQDLWKIVSPILVALGGGLLVLAKLVLSVLANTIGPVLKTIGVLLAGFLSVVRGVVETVVGLMTGDWATAWHGIVDIVVGTIKILIGVFAGPIAIITGIISGLVQGIYGFFKWLFDVLVGHSIVPDIVNGIIAVFQTLSALAQWVWDNVLKPIYDFFASAWNDYIKPAVSAWWDGLKAAWNGLLNAGQWIWDNVLKPVWNFFKSVWTDYISPFMSRVWQGLKNDWNGLLNAGQWIWDNVLKPVWDFFKSVWTDYIKPGLEQWWTWIKAAWNALGGLGQWVWSNVLKPVFGFFTGLWTDHVQPELASWGDKIHGAWDHLKNIGTWVQNNVLSPVHDAFVNTWTGIRDWFDKKGSMIVTPIAKVINVVIGVINKMIDGLNAIADALPGIDWNIGHIGAIDLKKLAAGGEIPARQANRGFVTTGARAIVGEGKANYPEFVIPTDPTHRKRAVSLLGQAGQKLGVNMYAAGGKLPKKHHKPDNGGILSTVKSIGGAIGGAVTGAAGTVADWIKGDLSKIVSTIFGPFKSFAQGQINKVQWDLGRKALDSTLNGVLGWISNQDKVYEAKAKSATSASTGGGSYQPYTPGGSSPWSRVSFRGFTLDAGQVQAILAAEKEYGGQFHITQGSYSTSVAASGSTHSGGGAFDMTSPVNDAALAALRHHGQAAWIRSPSQGPWPWHIHSLMIGDPNLSSSAAGQVMSFLAGGDGLATGGIVRRRAGGLITRIGEGSRDEAVIPLPHNWKSGVNGPENTGDTNLHFHGDLSFPNIKTGDDAETLIANLKSLAGGGA